MPDKAIGNQPVTQGEEIGKVLKGACAQRNLCPIKDIIARFADKWSVYTILLVGQYERRRFNELKAGIPGISQRMLTVTLRTLEEDGIITRKHFPEIPPRVEYQLSDLGRSLLQQMLPLANWADKNFLEIVKSRKKYAKKPEHRAGH